MKRIFPLAFVSLLPISLTSFIWLEVVHGVASRAIDGSGHYAVAEIYDQTIFPEVFGWLPAYFGGMSFPNFYPPLFFWIVSLIHHTQLLSFATSFKLVVALPLLLMPAAFWTIAWTHVGRDNRVALSTAIASATLYTTGEVFQPNTGLDMSSTLLDGFYTQPLGFLLLLLWILVYLLPRQRPWQFALASILLALTVLANFFNAITAILFIASVLVCDIISWFRTSDLSKQKELKKTFLVHLLSPWVALMMTAFWVAPMFSTYEYLVTRPVVRPLDQLMTTPLWCWYFLTAFGAAIWWRRSTGRIAPYLLACLILLIGLIFAGTLAPSWFPLQVFRFFATVNFLFCIPVGISVAYLANIYLEKRKARALVSAANENRASTCGRLVAVSVIALMGLSVLAVAMSTKKLTQASAFYTPETYERIRDALDFAKSHKDGRYLVEVLRSKATSGLVRSDSLALNAYLGAQGNETINIVYREASPNSSFFNAELNAFSAYRENFGISSALMDDLDFINQPLSQHIKRLQFIGVRYIVIATPEMKLRLSREPEIGERYDIGDWAIFSLRQPALPSVRALQYKPALVVSDFTVKLRRQNQIDFMRLAEEQFNDGWFDVLLARAAELRIDRLTDLEQFGAVILDTYGYEDENQAFTKIRDFAQTRPVILLSSDEPLFARLRSSLSQLPHAVLVERSGELGDWVDAQEPSHHYDQSAPRKVWKAIKSNLDRAKLNAPLAFIEGDIHQDHIDVSMDSNQGNHTTPVLLAITFHPKWRRTDGARLYAITPFFTLALINGPTHVVFDRSLHDRMALWVSLATLLALSCVTGLASLNQPRLDPTITKSVQSPPSEA